MTEKARPRATITVVGKPERIPARRLSEHERRMAVTRKLATWRLGDPSWADLLVGAYEDPSATERLLDEEKARYRA